MSIDSLKMEVTLLNDPEATVREIWQEAHAMGSNDSEGQAFQDILEKLHKKTLSPQKAIEEARSILDHKESYH
jgi:hypothetical protein